MNYPHGRARGEGMGARENVSDNWVPPRFVPFYRNGYAPKLTFVAIKQKDARTLNHKSADFYTELKNNSDSFVS